MRWAGPAGARALWTGRQEGNLAPPPAGPPAEAPQRRALVGRRWTWAHQVHGADVVVVDDPASGLVSKPGDALVSAHPAAALAVFTADCAPVALASPEGVVGAAHAGWRGLASGVLDNTASSMRELGATAIVAALGPCIHPECYPFSREGLDALASRFGDAVRSECPTGEALDLPAAVRAALAAAGVELIYDAGVCTACSRDYFSHRARRDGARQAMVVWKT